MLYPELLALNTICVCMFTFKQFPLMRVLLFVSFLFFQSQAEFIPSASKFIRLFSREFKSVVICLRLSLIIVWLSISFILLPPQTEGLARDLGLWSSGLVPVFHDAATHIKPLVLDLLNQFYIPLEERLLPCLTGKRSGFKK